MRKASMLIEPILKFYFGIEVFKGLGILYHFKTIIVVLIFTDIEKNKGSYICAYFIRRVS